MSDKKRPIDQEPEASPARREQLDVLKGVSRRIAGPSFEILDEHDAKKIVVRGVAEMILALETIARLDERLA